MRWPTWDQTSARATLVRLSVVRWPNRLADPVPEQSECLFESLISIVVHHEACPFFCGSRCCATEWNRRKDCRTQRCPVVIGLDRFSAGFAASRKPKSVNRGIQEYGKTAAASWPQLMRCRTISHGGAVRIVGCADTGNSVEKFCEHILAKNSFFTTLACNLIPGLGPGSCGSR
jgi:hypothetical protein